MDDRESENCIAAGDEGLLKVLKMVRHANNNNNHNTEASSVADLEKEISILISNYHAAQKEVDCLEMRNIDLLSREIELNSKCVRYQMNVAIMENVVKEQERQMQFKDDEVRNIRLILEQRIEEENRDSMRRDITEYELSARLADREETLDEMEELLGEKENVIEHLEANIHQLTEEIFKVNEVIDRQHTELEEKEIDLNKASEKSCKLGNENKLLRSKIHQINKKSEVLKRSLEDLENDLINRNNDGIGESANGLKSEERIRNLQCIIQNYERTCDKITDSLLEFGNENECLSERICDILNEIVIDENALSDNNDDVCMHVDEVKLAKVNRNTALNEEANNVRETSGSNLMKRSGILLFESPNEKHHPNVITEVETNNVVPASSKALLEHENRLEIEQNCGCLFANHKDTYGMSKVCNKINSGNGFWEKQPDQVQRQQKTESMDVSGFDENENALERGAVIEQKKMNDTPPDEMDSSNNSSNDWNIKETTQEAEQYGKGWDDLPREIKHLELQDELDGSIAGKTNSDVNVLIGESSEEETETNKDIAAKISDDSVPALKESSLETSADSFENICNDDKDMDRKGKGRETPTKGKSLYVLSFLDENNVNTTPRKEQHLRLDGGLLQSVPKEAGVEEDDSFHEIQNERNDGDSEKILLEVDEKGDMPVTVGEGEANEIDEGKINKMAENQQLDKEENEECETEIPIVFTDTKNNVPGIQEDFESREQRVAFPMQLPDAETTLASLEQRTEMDVSVDISKSEVQQTEEVSVVPDCAPTIETLTTADINASDPHVFTTERNVVKDESDQTIDFSQKEIPLDIEVSVISAENTVPNTLLMEKQTEPEASVPSVSDTMKKEEFEELSISPMNMSSVETVSIQEGILITNKESPVPDMPAQAFDVAAEEVSSRPKVTASEVNLPAVEANEVAEDSTQDFEIISIQEPFPPEQSSPPVDIQSIETPRVSEVSTPVYVSTSIEEPSSLAQSSPPGDIQSTMQEVSTPVFEVESVLESSPLEQSSPLVDIQSIETPRVSEVSTPVYVSTSIEEPSSLAQSSPPGDIQSTMQEVSTPVFEVESVLESSPLEQSSPLVDIQSIETPRVSEVSTPVYVSTSIEEPSSLAQSSPPGDIQSTMQEVSTPVFEVESVLESSPLEQSSPLVDIQSTETPTVSDVSTPVYVSTSIEEPSSLAQSSPPGDIQSTMQEVSTPVFEVESVLESSPLEQSSPPGDIQSTMQEVSTPVFEEESVLEPSLPAQSSSPGDIQSTETPRVSDVSLSEVSTPAGEVQLIQIPETQVTVVKGSAVSTPAVIEISSPVSYTPLSVESEVSTPAATVTLEETPAIPEVAVTIESVQSVKLPSVEDAPIPASNEQSVEDSLLPDVPVRDSDDPAEEQPLVPEGSASDLDTSSLDKLPSSQESAQAVDRAGAIVMGESVGVVETSLEEPRSVQEVDATTVDVPPIETPSIEGVSIQDESSIPETIVDSVGVVETSLEEPRSVQVVDATTIDVPPIETPSIEGVSTQDESSIPETIVDSVGVVETSLEEPRLVQGVDDTTVDVPPIKTPSIEGVSIQDESSIPETIVDSVGIVETSLEEPRSVQGVDDTTVDVSTIETPSIEGVSVPEESSIPEANVSGLNGPAVETPSLNEATFSVENGPLLEAPSDSASLIPADDVSSSFAPNIPEDLEKGDSVDPVISEGPFVLTDDLSISPEDIPEEKLILSEITTAKQEEIPKAPLVTLEGGINAASNTDETISKTSFPVSDVNDYEEQSKPADEDTEGNESELSEKVQIRLVEKFDDESKLKRSPSKDGELTAESIKMSMKMDSPISSSGEMPSTLVSSLMKENMQLREKVEELQEEKTMLVDEINNSKSSGDVEKNLKETLETVIAEKLFLLDQIEALKGIMLDFDDKYKEETAKLEESKEKLKVEIEQMKRNLAKKEEYLLAAKEKENYFMSLNDKKRQEVAGLEAKLYELRSEKENKERGRCEALSKELEEKRKEVENLKAKIASTEASYARGQALPSLSSSESSEVVNESYGATNLMEVDGAGANKAKKKKKFPIFCS